MIPVYNGASTVGTLVTRLIESLGRESLTVVLVNDGSTDASDEVCRALQAAAPGTVTYVNLSKNFGEHNAVMAGLNYATGDYTVIMDDDLQNPPEEVPRLIEYAILARSRRRLHALRPQAASLAPEPRQPLQRPRGDLPPG